MAEHNGAAIPVLGPKHTNLKRSKHVQALIKNSANSFRACPILLILDGNLMDERIESKHTSERV